MCTLTWRALGGAGGYELWFNRDELRTRAAELPPQACRTADGVAFLAPKDGQRGGTWLASNEYGLTVALLNDYGVTWRPSEPTRSRGDVVLAAAGAADLDAVAETLAEETLRHTGAFTLVALAAKAECGVWHWDGVRLMATRGAAVPDFFSSSSYRTETVIAARREAFLRCGAEGGAERQAYHFSHDKTRGAESVLMARPDACTRSVCAVRVEAGEVMLDYVPVRWGGEGAQPGEAVRTNLRRVRREAGGAT